MQNIVIYKVIPKSKANQLPDWVVFYLNLPPIQPNNQNREPG